MVPDPQAHKPQGSAGRLVSERLLPIAGDERHLPVTGCGLPIADCCRLEVSVLSSAAVWNPMPISEPASPSGGIRRGRG